MQLLVNCLVDTSVQKAGASRLPRLLGTLQYDLAQYPRGKEVEAGSSSGLVGPKQMLKDLYHIG